MICVVVYVLQDGHEIVQTSLECMPRIGEMVCLSWSDDEGVRERTFRITDLCHYEMRPTRLYLMELDQ